MIETQLNMFDSAVIGIMALSCLFAFFRGFVKEVLSLVGWVGAGLITIYYFPTVAEKLKPHFKTEMVSAAVATVGIYIAALIGFAIVNRLLLKFIKSGNDVGVLDNLFGLMFGALRGAFVVSLGYLMMLFAIGDNEQPDWIKKSITRPYVEDGAVILAGAAPRYLQELAAMQENAADRLRKRSEDEEDKPVVIEEGTGYTKKTSSQVDRLIEGLKNDE